MKHQSLRLLSALVMMTLLLAACAPAATPAPAQPTATQAPPKPEPTKAPEQPTEAPPTPEPTQPPKKAETIDVLLPPWAQVPQEMLDEFEKESGIKVNLIIADWDAIRDKVSVAGASGAPLADVVEFDWSWTGQFSQSGWFIPLEDLISKELFDDLLNKPSFTAGGHLYAIPYSNDFRISAYNTAMFEQAGIGKPPATFDELKADLKLLQDKGISKTPLCLFMSPTENSSTTWYLLTLAMGGELFDANGKPAFTDPNSGGYRALQFMVDMNKAGYVGAAGFSPDTSMDTEFIAGKCAFHVSTGPATITLANDPSQSSIVGQAALTLVPGMEAPTATFGLPEGVGIMKSSKKQEAALEFINWWMRPENMLRILSELGLMPTRTSVLQALIKEDKLPGGQVVVDQAALIKPLFPQGTPAWYSQFSIEAATLLNSAIKGDISVEEALNQLAEKAAQLQAGQ